MIIIFSQILKKIIISKFYLYIKIFFFFFFLLYINIIALLKLNILNKSFLKKFN